MRSQSTEHEGKLRVIAVMLMAFLFFGNDPVDKLPYLLRAWQPATFSKKHLENIVELGYMTFKVALSFLLGSRSWSHRQSAA